MLLCSYYAVMLCCFTGDIKPRSYVTRVNQDFIQQNLKIQKMVQFSIECRKTKTKIQWTNQNGSKQIHVADAKRGKTCSSKFIYFWLVNKDFVANHKA